MVQSILLADSWHVRGYYVAASIRQSILFDRGLRPNRINERTNTMRSVARLTLLSLLTTLLCAACVKGPGGEGKRVKGSGPVRIGFSMDTLKEERWQRDKALVE